MASWHACVLHGSPDGLSDDCAIGRANRRPCTLSTAVPAGERFVIDPYSEGMLLPENEVGLGAGQGVLGLFCAPAWLVVMLRPAVQLGWLLWLFLAHATPPQGRDELAKLFSNSSFRGRDELATLRLIPSSSHSIVFSSNFFPFNFFSFNFLPSRSRSCLEWRVSCGPAATRKCWPPCWACCATRTGALRTLSSWHSMGGRAAVQVVVIVLSAMLCLTASSRRRHASTPNCAPYPLPAGVPQSAARRSRSGLCQSM